MDNQNFYIIIENRTFRHSNYDNDFHIERVFDKNQVLKLIEDDISYNSDDVTFVIVTDDIYLLSKYIVALNPDDLKLICRVETLNLNKTRISKNFARFNDDVFEYFEKIKAGEIISATMSWLYESFQPYEDSSYTDTIMYFDKWITNKEFKYFKTPARYRKTDDEIFYFENIEVAGLEKFNKILNIDILSISESKEPQINWEIRGNYLRYYDRISQRRIYITPDILKELKLEPAKKLLVETNLDHNFYIEYYITGFYIEDDFEDSDSYNDGYDDNRPSYDKYNGAYGFDDETIDSAFEGDPENTWNID